MKTDKERFKEPTDLQVKKFWEKCGFYSKVITSKSADFNGIYMDKNGNFKKMPDTYERTLWHDPEITPDSGCRDYWYAENGLPPIDLNNLFRYAIPKVYEELCRKGRYYKMMKIYKSVEYQAKWGEYNPDIELFWAIWEALKHE